MSKTPNWQKWIDHRLPIFSFIKKDLKTYPTPKNLNYLWNFGSLAGLTLVVMMLTGIFLAMHYDPSEQYAFQSIEHIMRDVNYGWLLRYIHMNGASMFFIIIYIHMLRGLYYGSYKNPRELLWILGVIIYLLMMLTAFLGYVLPWGQMSYWGATVITSMFSAIPLIGDTIVSWIWGGFTVSNPTLNRFFVLHYLFPFLIVGCVLLHLVALHVHKSNNPAGIDLRKQDMLPFHPFYTIKDLLGLGIYIIVFAFFVFFAPNFFGEPINYEPANPLVTPEHIVPEWYFLPFYAILRSVPDKLGGVILMLGAVFILFIVPWLDTHPVRSATYRPIYKWAFWLLITDLFVLCWVGANPPKGIFILIGQFATAFYFFFFLVLMPILSKFENPLSVPRTLDDIKKRKLPFFSIIFYLILFTSFSSIANHETQPSLPKLNWSFDGPFGTFDRAQLQRGFQVYKEVCSACHSLENIYYRDLSALGYSKKEIKAFALETTVKDGPNDEGEMFDIPGRPSDKFFFPYLNENAARAANNGAFPPNLSLIVKARLYGTDYVYGLLTGYCNAPKGIEVPEGMSYNTYFRGHLLSMPPPLITGAVTFSDGMPATVDQMSRDVAAFLTWAAEPEMEVRKQMGIKVIIFTMILTILFFFAMRRIWARMKE